MVFLGLLQEFLVRALGRLWVKSSAKYVGNNFAKRGNIYSFEPIGSRMLGYDCNLVSIGTQPLEDLAGWGRRGPKVMGKRTQQLSS